VSARFQRPQPFRAESDKLAGTTTVFGPGAAVLFYERILCDDPTQSCSS